MHPESRPRVERPLIQLNHPSSGDLVTSPTHVAGYGTGFEGVVAIRLVQADGTVLAETGVQSSGGMERIGEFFGEITFDSEPSQTLGFIEAWDAGGRGGPGQSNLVRIPVVFR